MRTVGVASAAAALALGVAGTASACNIKDFSFTGSVTCDQPSGTGVITVHDTDGTRPVTITVKDDSGKQLATQQYTGRSGDFTISVPWSAGAHYQVLASVQRYFDNQSVGNGVTLPNTDCGASTTPTSPPASPTDSPTPSDSPTTSPTTSPSAGVPSASPSAVASTSAAAVADTSSPSPSGNLAETGGGSNTGMIAGIAGALVVVGGGAVFGLRRRTASARH
ncbi:LAETG motif-containing sortase-dependent surface protein [Streptomyces sp. SN-593]|uniref:LAETG motif-containing sortase-dependent surface protein n=1 Tax=Actinacidiphila reveromycinica TaxID=659352 RepID=UPI001F218B51|nr:LAETG motif-containing sortase-dependent surface protein [Streptomyces sp. SN-593]